MSKEAMEIALEALKDSQDYIMGRAMTVEAAETLEEALAKQEQGEPVACYEADELLRCLGLDPQTYRTNGGAINRMKVKAALSHPDEYPRIDSIDAMVNRFLTWPVPASVHPDGISGKLGRTGTNLLNADEARQMLEYVFATPPAAQPKAKQEQGEPVAWRVRWTDGSVSYREEKPSDACSSECEVKALYVKK